MTSNYSLYCQTLISYTKESDPKRKSQLAKELNALKAGLRKVNINK